MIPAVKNVRPLMRLIQSVGKRYYALRGTRFVIKQRFGATFLLDPRSLVDRHLLYFRSWEDEQRAYLQEAFRDNPPEVVLDIGAYIGLYAITLAKRWPSSEVIAFEPEPGNFRQLHANVMLNELSNCTVHNLALGEAKGKATITGPAQNRGESRLADHSGEANVSVEALDDLHAFAGKRLCVKIDVEGYERQVIAGMRKTLTDNSVFAQIEVFDANRDAVIADLEELGFTLYHQIDDDLYFTNDE